MKANYLHIKNVLFFLYKKITDSVEIAFSTILKTVKSNNNKKKKKFETLKWHTIILEGIFFVILSKVFSCLTKGVFLQDKAFFFWILTLY